MNCDSCDKVLVQAELSNKVLKDMGLESGGKVVRVEAYLCESCYDEVFKND